MASPQDPVSNPVDDERLPIQWDNGGSTTIPYSAMERGKKLRECIICEGVCEPENVRGMVCTACRTRPVPGEAEDDVIELLVECDSR